MNGQTVKYGVKKYKKVSEINQDEVCKKCCFYCEENNTCNVPASCLFWGCGENFYWKKVK